MDTTGPVQPMDAEPQAVPVAQAPNVPAVFINRNKIKSVHMLLTVFGAVNISLWFVGALVSLMGPSTNNNEIGSALFLLMGFLGTVAGGMMNPCNCVDQVDPLVGDCACGNNTKCISIISIVNSLVHLGCGIVLMVLMVIIGNTCDVAEEVDGCMGIGNFLMTVYGICLAWVVISGIICVVAAITAWKADASNMAMPKSRP
jgi:hypothetical protein